jgi:hypothetical protein
MGKKSLLQKLASAYVWGNLVAIALVVILLSIGVKVAMDWYTHHGESIVVPNVVNMQYDDAKEKLKALGLDIMVNDTGYNQKLPPDCILEQTPVEGKRVKGGFVVFVTINSAGAPTLVLPDVIDNGSWREVRSQLVSMGFRMAEPEYIPGEKDWVYGVKVGGRRVQTGDRISTEAKLVVMVGDGTRSASDSVNFDSSGLEFEDFVQEPEYIYEEVEVPIDYDEHKEKETTTEAPSAEAPKP